VLQNSIAPARAATSSRDAIRPARLWRAPKAQRQVVGAASCVVFSTFGSSRLLEHTVGGRLRRLKQFGIPWSRRDFEARISSTSLSARSSSPGRTGRGQRKCSKPAPMIPPAGLSSLSTSSRMVTAAVCQPLAARPRNIDSAAALSSRWNTRIEFGDEALDALLIDADASGPAKGLRHFKVF
jgi:hypothetical protein